MIYLVSLLATAALLSLQCVVYGQLPENLEMSNHLMPDEIPTVRRSSPPTGYIKLKSPPPETVRALPGSSFVLQCMVSGSPSPFINWMKNGVPISDYEEEGNEVIASPPFSPAQMVGKLLVRLPSNGDVFTCVGIAGMIEITASTTVIVEGDQTEMLPAMIPMKPLITAYYTDVMQHVGTSITLPCRFESNIKAQVVWVGNMSKVIHNNSRMRILPSGDLHITVLKWEDMGGFYCTVKNALGKDTSETFLYPVQLKKQF